MGSEFLTEFEGTVSYYKVYIAYFRFNLLQSSIQNSDIQLNKQKLKFYGENGIKGSSVECRTWESDL